MGPEEVPGVFNWWDQRRCLIGGTRMCLEWRGSASSPDTLIKFASGSTLINLKITL